MPYHDADYDDVLWLEAIGLTKSKVETDKNFAAELNKAVKDNDVNRVGDLLLEITESTLPAPIRNRVYEIKGRIRELAGELVKLYAIPPEPIFVDQPTIITFVKTWGGMRPYTYAAIRVNEKWWVTGNRANNSFNSWEKLWEFINRQEQTTPMVLLGHAWENLNVRL